LPTEGMVFTLGLFFTLGNSKFKTRVEKLVWNLQIREIKIKNKKGKVAIPALGLISPCLGPPNSPA
jgi:hypothetical protein